MLVTFVVYNVSAFQHFLLELGAMVWCGCWGLQMIRDPQKF